MYSRCNYRQEGHTFRYLSASGTYEVYGTTLQLPKSVAALTYSVTKLNVSFDMLFVNYLYNTFGRSLWLTRMKV